jgi:hypothetical protein
MTNENPADLQIRLQTLIDVEIDHSLPPDQRLLLAVLRQSFLDYFDDDPAERESAADYFALSPLYPLTLSMLELPEDLLPEGIEEKDIQVRRDRLNNPNEPDSLRLETLVRQLSGNQLKVVMTMGLLSLPAVAGKIAAGCQMSRTTVNAALVQLEAQGLVERQDESAYQYWSLPLMVIDLLDEIWGE